MITMSQATYYNHYYYEFVGAMTQIELAHRQIEINARGTVLRDNDIILCLNRYASSIVYHRDVINYKIDAPNRAVFQAEVYRECHPKEFRRDRGTETNH